MDLAASPYSVVRPISRCSEMAVQFLEDACESRETLKVVVDMQPTLDHLGELGHRLLLKFMSTPAGFRYLYQTEFIEREMNAWFHVGTFFLYNPIH
jgi:rapamycin-insensitive companion of mTOR